MSRRQAVEMARRDAVENERALARARMYEAERLNAEQARLAQAEAERSKHVAEQARQAEAEAVRDGAKKVFRLAQSGEQARENYLRGEITTVAMTEAECLQFGVPFGSTWKKHQANAAAAAPFFSQMAGAGGQVPPDSGRQPEAMRNMAAAAAPLSFQMAGAGGQAPPDSGRQLEAMRNMGVTQFIQEDDSSIARTKNASASSGMATSDVVHVLVSRLEQEAERAGSLTSRLKHLIVKKLCISRLHWCMRMWTLGAAHSRNLSGAPTLLALLVQKKYKY